MQLKKAASLFHSSRSVASGRVVQRETALVGIMYSKGESLCLTLVRDKQLHLSGCFPEASAEREHVTVFG